MQKFPTLILDAKSVKSIHAGFSENWSSRFGQTCGTKETEYQTKYQTVDFNYASLC